MPAAVATAKYPCSPGSIVVGPVAAMLSLDSVDPTVIMPHASLAKGDVCNVSVFNLNTHAGTHMDSPWHFLKGLGTMDDLPFEAVIGPCRVVEIKDKESVKPNSRNLSSRKANASSSAPATPG